MAYNPTVYVNDNPPALNADNLNKSEQGIANVTNLAERTENYLDEGLEKFEKTGNDQLFNKYDCIYVKDIAINSAKTLVSASGHNMLICKSSKVAGLLCAIIINSHVTLSEIKMGVSTVLYTTTGNTLESYGGGTAENKTVRFNVSYNTDFYVYLDYKLSNSSYIDLRDYVALTTPNYASTVKSYYKDVEASIEESLVPYVKTIDGLGVDGNNDVDIMPLFYDVKNDLYKKVLSKQPDKQLYDWRTITNNCLVGYAINSSGNIVESNKSYIIAVEVNGQIGDSFSFNYINSTLEYTGMQLCASNNVLSPTATTQQRSATASASAKRGFITLNQNSKYLFISTSYGSATGLEDNMLSEQKKLVVRPGTNYDTTYYDYYAFVPSVNPSDIIEMIEEYAVLKSQGALNQGKVLVISEDGEVIPGEVEEPVTTNVPVRVFPTTTLKTGSNLISNATEFSGTNWSGSQTGGFIHATGSTDPLIFDLDTVSGGKYIVDFECTELTKKFYVVMGDSDKVDPYNGTNHMYVGFISDGGKLKLYPDSNFDGTITNLKLRKVEYDGAETITITSYEVQHGSMISDLTGFWNVAVGGPNVLSNSQNASRNVGIGYGALKDLKTGLQNISIGTWSMPYVTIGRRNVSIGADTLYNTAYMNVHSEANDNVAIGKATMANGVLVEKNTAVGVNAMSKNDPNANSNTCIGYSAGTYAHVGNTAVGISAGAYTKGNNNTSVGRNAGNTLYVTGSNNVCVGFNAGFEVSGASASSIKTVDNSIAIGYGVKATESNQARIGNADQTIFLCGKKIVFNLDGTVTWEAE